MYAGHAISGTPVDHLKDDNAKKEQLEINENNFRDYSLEDIEEKIKDNKQEIRRLLKEYFAMRQKEVQKNIQSKMKDPGNNKKGSVKKKSSAGKNQENQAEEPAHHTDIIIEEYINLVSINQELYSNTVNHQSASKEAPNKDAEKDKNLFTPDHHEAHHASKFDKSLKMPFQAKDQSKKKQDKLQNKEFKNIKMSVLRQITDQVSAFSENFNKRIQNAEDIINQQIMKKLDGIYDHFGALPDADKEYFLRKIQEKAVRDRQKNVPVTH